MTSTAYDLSIDRVFHQPCVGATFHAIYRPYGAIFYVKLGIIHIKLVKITFVKTFTMFKKNLQQSQKTKI